MSAGRQDRCKWCNELFFDCGGLKTTTRRHEGGAQCSVCIRVVAADPLRFKTKALQAAEEAELKADGEMADEKRAAWKVKMRDVAARGRNGRAGSTTSASTGASGCITPMTLSSCDPSEWGMDDEDSTSAVPSAPSSKVEPERYGLDEFIGSKRGRKTVARKALGVFWPIWRLAIKFKGAGAKRDKPKGKAYTLNGEKGFLLDETWACPAGCSWLEEHTEDGFAYTKEMLKASLLANPGDSAL